MKYIIIITSIILLSSSCKSWRNTPIIVTDTIKVTEYKERIVIDSIIAHDTISSYIELQAECDSNNEVIIKTLTEKTKGLNSTVDFKNGLIKVYAGKIYDITKSYESKIHVRDSILKISGAELDRLRNIINDKDKKIYKQQAYIKLLGYMLIILILVIAVYLLYRRIFK